MIAEMDFELVIITNQDGLGTDSFPEVAFFPAHNKIINAFVNEGIVFSNILIDRTFPADNAPTRKPGTGLLNEYLNGNYDLENSFVIGDRFTDMELAKNIGSKGIFMAPPEIKGYDDSLIVLQTTSWKAIYEYLRFGLRKTEITRTTNETSIKIKINLDGAGVSTINTGISFFDHMLEQVSRHALIDLDIEVRGDLDVDEHHTIEDTAIVLGEAIKKAIDKKEGLERYGFYLPMDDCLAQVAIDFGGRNWIEWDANFKREKIGNMPTEMFYHFFKSFSDAAKCNLNIKAEGVNEHHKIEAIFKAFSKAIKMAIKRDLNNWVLPSTKGTL